MQRLSAGRLPQISTHAPRTGSDGDLRRALKIGNVFQPTLPARGATLLAFDMETTRLISTHAPRTGSDRKILSATCGCIISTHAPRTGSDGALYGGGRNRGYFNPRSPHGERPGSEQNKQWLKEFQPTLPARGATQSRRRRPAVSRFQPTLPARGATYRIFLSYQSSMDFNPRSPHGERQECGWRCSSGCHFNPRSPHGERQRKVTILSIRIIGFAQKVYHKTVLLRISLAENAVILPKRPQNPVRTSLQKAGGLRFARAIRAARPYSISSPSGA